MLGARWNQGSILAALGPPAPLLAWAVLRRRPGRPQGMESSRARADQVSTSDTAQRVPWSWTSNVEELFELSALQDYPLQWQSVMIGTATLAFPLGAMPVLKASSLPLRIQA